MASTIQKVRTVCYERKSNEDCSEIRGPWDEAKPAAPPMEFIQAQH